MCTESKRALTRSRELCRTLNFKKGWYSLRASLLATYKNKTPWSKTAKNTSHSRQSIWASPLAADENKQATSRSTTHYHQPTDKPIIINTQPSPIASAKKSQVVALAIQRRLAKKRPLQQCGAKEDGPTKRCGRTKSAKREQPHQANKKKARAYLHPHNPSRSHLRRSRHNRYSAES